MKALIKEIKSVSSEGVIIHLTEKVTMGGQFRSDKLFVQWDQIGRALFGSQYSYESSRIDLQDIKIQMFDFR